MQGKHCDQCGQFIPKGHMIYQPKSRVGIYCSFLCFAKSYVVDYDYEELTDEVMANNVYDWEQEGE